MKNMSIPSIKHIVSILISLFFIVVAIGIVYATLSGTLSPTNSDGYFAATAKTRIDEGLGVSSREHSLDGFPFIMLIIPFVLVPMIYAINKYIIGHNAKTICLNTAIVFVFVLSALAFSAFYYYNNYGKTLMVYYEALGPNVYIPEPAKVEPPT